jgi:hypothetical protein
MMAAAHRPCPASLRGCTRARGAASLGVVVVWLVAASLVVLYVNRALVFEQRASANQLRATLAFEAAEAGAEWSLATLGHPGPVDAACQAAAAGGPSAPGSLRARLLQEDPLTAGFTAGPAQAGCSKPPGGAWQCSCPASGAPEWPAGAAAAAFAVRVEPGLHPRTFGLVSTGCANASGFCGAEQADAHAQVRVSVAAVPLLAHAPTAALMAQGAITLGAGALVANTDEPSGGTTAVAGRDIASDAGTQLVSQPGRPGAASLAPQDAHLRDTSVWTQFLGMGPALYRELPGVHVLACGAQCSAADVSTAWAGGARPVLWVDGGLVLDAGLPLGSVQAPLLLVVDGPLRLGGTVQAWGLAVAGSITWDATGGGGARWQGALLAQHDIAMTGGAQVHFDAEVLQQLARLQAFVRIPGGWHDFEK